MDTSTRLKGHGLQSEGKPFEDDGRGGTRRTELYGGPVGFGLCACGARSGVLDSDYARQVWHREVHKPEARARMDADKALRNAHPLEDVFWKFCTPTPDGCWIWAGNRRSSGYGRVVLGAKHYYAHRVSFELHNGPIPDGMTVDHECHNQDADCPGGSVCPHRLCVRPDHLELETAVANAAKAGLVLRTGRCGKGHIVAGSNVYMVHGNPICRECHLARQARYGAKLTAARGHKDEVRAAAQPEATTGETP